MIKMLQITPDQAYLFCEWFHALEDTNPAFLEQKDYDLYHKITNVINEFRTAHGLQIITDSPNHKRKFMNLKKK